MGEYKKSEFKTRRLAPGVREEDTTKRQVFDTFGLDINQINAETHSKARAGEIFSERFDDVVIPKETLKEKIDEQYSQQISHGKKLSGMSKSKRAKSAEKKLELQRHLRDENKLFAEKRESDTEFMEKYTSQDYIEGMSRNYSPQERVVLREWAIQETKTNRGEISSMREVFSWDDYRQMEGYQGILKEVDSVPIETFSYSSDEEFVSGFAEKYDLICKQEAAQLVFQKFLERSDDEACGLPIARLKARMEIIGEIKKDYEDRMEMISSPYYTLLSAKDMAQYSDPDNLPADMEPQLAEYIRLYHKLENSTVGKGRMMDKYKSVLGEKERERKDMDVARVDSILGDIAVNTEFSGRTEDEVRRQKVDQVRGICREIGQKAVSSYPIDNVEFIQNVEGQLGRTPMSGISSAEMDAMEKKLAKIYTEEKVGDTPLTGETLTRFKAAFNRFCEARRIFQADTVVEDFLYSLQNEFFTDTENAEFKKTEQYKKLQALAIRVDDAEDIQMESVAAKQEYFGAFLEAFQVLKESGLTISEKEADMERKHGEAVADALTEYRRQEGDSFEFKKVTINGRVYTSYKTSSFMESLGGKTIDIPEYLEAEIMPMMEELDRLQTQLMRSQFLLREQGGEKTMLDMVYSKIIYARLPELEKKLQMTLFTQVTMKNAVVGALLDHEEPEIHMGDEESKTKYAAEMEKYRKEADDTYDSTTDKNLAKNKIYTGIGLRRTESERAQADRALRGNIFEPEAATFESLIKAIFSEECPKEQLVEAVENKHLPNNQMQIATGGGAEYLVSNMLQLLDEKMSSEVAFEYFKTAYQTIGDFKVYENSKQTFVRFQTQAICNTLTGQMVSNIRNSADMPEEATRYTMKISQCLMAMSRLEESTDRPEIAAFIQENPTIAPLLAQYKEIIDKMTDRLKDVTIPERQKEKGTEEGNES
ncbi:MAG: hypothetical protein K6A69_01170 [Lachnospiraceae bacterium]|nr:hypothetical protein [Lachnospiraceae bacterium]